MFNTLMLHDFTSIKIDVRVPEDEDLALVLGIELREAAGKTGITLFMNEISPADAAKAFEDAAAELRALDVVEVDA